jgi:hypothetical protein
MIALFTTCEKCHYVGAVCCSCIHCLRLVCCDCTASSQFAVASPKGQVICLDCDAYGPPPADDRDEEWEE